MELKFEGVEIIKLFLQKIELLTQQERTVLIKFIELSTTPIIYFKPGEVNQEELHKLAKQLAPISFIALQKD